MNTKRGRTTSPVAVVVGGEVNGLGVVRSLEKAGVATIILDTDLTRPTLATRFGKKVRAASLSGETLVDSLLQLAGDLAQKPVLFLTQEDSVVTVSAARERLAGAYHFSMASQEVMLTLLDKHGFQSAAEKMRCPIPRSLRLTRETDVGSIDNLRFPCVIKPMTKDAAYSAKFVKAYKVGSAGEAAALWAEMRKVVAEVIVQEWIEGGDSDVYFCLQYRSSSNAPAVSFVGRKICQWPPLVGGTASCIPAPEAWEELVSLTDAFFDRVGFVGIGSMEYKRDSRDGRFYMVEPTVGRTDYQEEIATLNGVNIPYAAYCAELGLPIPRTKPVARPQAWRDSVSYQKALSAGAADPISTILPDAKIVDAYFRTGDPRPYFCMKLEPVQRRMRWLLPIR